jgi:hypothetical protein
MQVGRRQFLQASAAAGLALTNPFAFTRAFAADSSSQSIDRAAVVKRHNPTVTAIDPFSALSIGNGEFAFTADVTGLQTFPEAYQKEFPLCTTSHWAWHTTPAPEGVRAEGFRYKIYDAHGRKVSYNTDSHGQEPLFKWLRESPHRMHLGRVGFEMRLKSSQPATPDDVKNVHQTLDLWTGLLESRFEVEGAPVHTMTCCNPELDLLAVRVESPLLADGRLRLLLAFPYPSPQIDMADWASTKKHRTIRSEQGLQAPYAELERIVDDDRYFVQVEWSYGQLEMGADEHRFLLNSGTADQLEATFHFSRRKPAGHWLASFTQSRAGAAKHWEEFWSTGGAVDLGNCTDPRASELERRIVLSQYNTALHCAGSLPPAETGLLFNSWYGKFHLEMHWWHGVHFAAWNRFALFEKSLGYYEKILPVARAIAKRQGYKGARWPKMVGPDGHDSPSPVGPLLIWQQPHPIYYAELCYRANPSKETLEKWQAIVFDSAAFMADYAAFDETNHQYVLGSPIKTVSENNDTNATSNPTFELAYWRFGLRTAQTWRERLGMPRDQTWDRVLENLAPLPTDDGRYLFQEGLTDTYTKWNWEHPALIGALGMQPGDGVDLETMHRTLKKVMEVWQWDRAWGWDFPMSAMCAARVGEPELAIRALLIDSPKNRYHPNGHAYQRPNLTAYLPANGGLLSAVAMMAAGWTNGPKSAAPGFPADGKWSVKHEGLREWI